MNPEDVSRHLLKLLEKINKFEPMPSGCVMVEITPEEISAVTLGHRVITRMFVNPFFAADTP